MHCFKRLVVDNNNDSNNNNDNNSNDNYYYNFINSKMSFIPHKIK